MLRMECQLTNNAGYVQFMAPPLPLYFEFFAHLGHRDSSPHFPRRLFTDCREASATNTRLFVIARSSTTWQSADNAVRSSSSWARAVPADSACHPGLDTDCHVVGLLAMTVTHFGQVREHGFSRQHDGVDGQSPPQDCKKRAWAVHLVGPGPFDPASSTAVDSVGNPEELSPEQAQGGHCSTPPVWSAPAC